MGVAGFSKIFLSQVLNQYVFHTSNAEADLDLCGIMAGPMIACLLPLLVDEEDYQNYSSIEIEVSIEGLEVYERKFFQCDISTDKISVISDLADAVTGSLIFPGNSLSFPNTSIDSIINLHRQLVEERISSIEPSGNCITIPIGEYYQRVWGDANPFDESCDRDRIVKILETSGIAKIINSNDSKLVAKNAIDCLEATLNIESGSKFDKNIIDSLPAELLTECVIAAVVESTEEVSMSLQNMKDKFIPIVSMVSFISAIFYTKSARELLALKLGKDVSLIVYPKEVISLNERISHFFARNMVSFQNEEMGSSKVNALGAFNHFKSSLRNDADVYHFIRAVLEEHGSITMEGIISTLLAAQGSGSLYLLENLRRLNPVGRQVASQLHAREQFRALLASSVVGQNIAIEAVVNEWFASKTGKAGPRMILTFLGVSGVGKSHLAREFTKNLNIVEKTDYKFIEFPMSQFGGDQRSFHLFGLEFGYDSSTMGSLTAPVRAYPRHVLLFDEVEKAHENVIQSLLGFLDSGFALDKNTNEMVDFSQCIIIFTTNIGAHLLSQNRDSSDLNVFDVLRASPSVNSSSNLSPELVNRLSKGGSAIFSELSIHYFVRAAKIALTASTEYIPGLQINWRNDYEDTIVKLCSPEVKVRRLNSVYSSINSVIVESISQQIIDNNTKKIFVNVIDETALIQLYGSVYIATAKVVDSSILAPISEKYSVSFEVFSSFTSLLQRLKEDAPKVLIIDFSLLNYTLEITQALNEICSINSVVPIYLILDTADRTNNNIKPISGFSSVRDIVETPSNELSDFLNAISQSLVDFSIEEDIEALIRRNKKVAYKVSPTKIDNDAIEVDLVLTHTVDSISIQDHNHPWFERVVPKERFEHVFGLDRAKTRLSEVLVMLKNPEKYTSDGIKPPTGYLLTGGPGTGKTLIARALAGECGLPFISPRLGDLYAGGDPIKAIKDLFSLARRYAPSIIFIDEIEAIGKSREQGGNSMLVNTLLTEMDGFSKSIMPVFVLAATNHHHIIDPALLRPGRFDEIIRCDHLNAEGRRKMLSHKFSSSDLSISTIGALVEDTVGFSSAEIDQIYREATYLSKAKGVVIDISLLRSIIRNISFGLPSENYLMSASAKRLTAYHECGHLFAHLLLMPKNRINFITIEPRDQTLGFVATIGPEEMQSNTKAEIHKLAIVYMAGRAAEYLLSRDWDLVSTGAGSDLARLTTHLKLAVFQCGILSDIPALNYDELANSNMNSEYVRIAEKALVSWISNIEKDTIAILNENWVYLVDFAEILIKKESMVYNEIQEALQYIGFNVDLSKQEAENS